MPERRYNRRSTGTKTGESQVRSPLKTLYRYRPTGLVSSSTMTRKISTCKALLSVTGIGFPSLHFIGCMNDNMLKTMLKFLRHEQREKEIDEHTQRDDTHQDVFHRSIHTFPPLFARDVHSPR